MHLRGSTEPQNAELHIWWGSTSNGAIPYLVNRCLLCSLLPFAQIARMTALLGANFTRVRPRKA